MGFEMEEAPDCLRGFFDLSVSIIAGVWELVRQP